MFASPLRAAAIAAAALGLSACNAAYGIGLGSPGYYDPYYDGYGYKSGYGYNTGYGYGYDSGYGYGYPSGGYGHSPYGYGYGSGFPSYYGWNDGYYYPGTGYYVYDQYRRPHRWSGPQERYWRDRQRTYSDATQRGVREMLANWGDFRRDRRQDNKAYRVERRDDRRELRRGTVTREEYRTDRRDDRRAYRVERREDRRELRRETRDAGAAMRARLIREQRQASRSERRATRQEQLQQRREGDDE